MPCHVSGPERASRRLHRALAYLRTDLHDDELPHGVRTLTRGRPPSVPPTRSPRRGLCQPSDAVIAYAPPRKGGGWMAPFRVGVDIGGTFTDIVFLDADGRIHTKKVSSTVDNYARGIIEGLQEVFREVPLRGSDVAEVLHG